MKNEGISKIRTITSVSDDPWYNLAFEEYLLGQVQEGEVILYLWQNKDTVVIGRNQNAWKECRCQLLEENAGKLARRLSGGGAVFHDLGNLNFTFLMDRKLYNPPKQLQVILTAVKMMGIEAEFSGRNDLVVGNKKFSGNAFYFTDQTAYHHGTILIDSDFSKLVKYLQVSKEKIQSKGIDSVRSRVVNLKELNTDLTINAMEQALKESFVNNYKASRAEHINNLGSKIVDPSQMKELDELYEKYSSWEWRFGNSPNFDITYEERFEWGGLELCFTLENGIVEEAVIYSDAMESKLLKLLSKEFTGIPFRLEEFIKCIDMTEDNMEEGSTEEGFGSKYTEIMDDIRSCLRKRDW